MEVSQCGHLRPCGQGQTSPCVTGPQSHSAQTSNLPVRCGQIDIKLMVCEHGPLVVVLPRVLGDLRLASGGLLVRALLVSTASFSATSKGRFASTSLPRSSLRIWMRWLLSAHRQLAACDASAIRNRSALIRPGRIISTIGSDPGWSWKDGELVEIRAVCIRGEPPVAQGDRSNGGWGGQGIG